MFQNIPEEMKRFNQWVVWRLVDTQSKKPTKVPYCARTGKLAAVDDAATWSTYDQCVATSTKGGYDGIGFVFTKHDPFTGIDLDDPYEKREDGSFVHANPDEIMDRQKKIFQVFDSYSEFSPSGNGLHLIVRGEVPSGRRRSSVEVYSSDRYFTMTGNIHHNAPIQDRNNLLQTLWAEMAKGAESINYYAGDILQQHEDDRVIEMASSASNGQKFNDLFGGSFQSYYSSQSEADFALIDIIAHYTKHRMQIVRIFQMSALGKREKATRGKYLTQMVDKSFDRMLPPVDFSEIINQVNEARAAAHNPTAALLSRITGGTPVFDIPHSGASGPAASPVTVEVHTTAGSGPKTPLGTDANAWRTAPSGLMGAIAEFIFNQAPRPVYEIALVGAIGLMAGIAGRAYNASGTGLNHYILALASTGVGKEAISQGIEKLLASVSKRVAHATDVVGPADLASGQALLKHMSKRPTPCFVSIVGEFGLRMKMISDANASNAEKMLRRVLLDLYNKSGANNMVRPTVYSDANNNTETMHSPAFSMVGESVPSHFYEALDENMIREGLLPRFIIVEYTGPRVASNEQAWLVQPSSHLVDGVEKLIMVCHDSMNNGNIINISPTADAAELLRRIDLFADDQINNSEAEILKQLWNRLHIKVFKMAGLLAVSDNFSVPTITTQHVEWALSLIMHDINALINKFELGEVGEANPLDECVKSISRGIATYLFGDVTKLKNLKHEYHQRKLIPREWIQQRTSSNAAFRKTKDPKAFQSAIDTMHKMGYIRRCGPTELLEFTKNVNGDVFAPTDVDYFMQIFNEK